MNKLSIANVSFGWRNTFLVIILDDMVPHEDDRVFEPASRVVMLFSMFRTCVFSFLKNTN